MAEGGRLRVRPMCPAEARACADIFVAARRRARPDVPADRFSTEDFDLATAGLEILIVEHQGLVAGFAGLDRHHRELELLFVSPEAQGRGAGALLLAESGRILGLGAHLRCDARNTSGRAFYRAQGWVETGESWGRIQFTRPDPIMALFPSLLGVPLFAL
ncbi:MAG: GNAT family N-acetyltransferase [Zavarzinia sp.]|nr:GNAT family N-acetyltransferase [Zavarzinia sp.]